MHYVKNMYYLRLVAVVLMLILVPSFTMAEDFPYRKDYPNVPAIELADLKIGYDTGVFIIVDVRSKLEFDTIHIKDAIHIPIADILFEERMITLAKENPGKKIASYCNGVTCLKSYEAAQRSINVGLDNVYAFDAGIPAWAKSYPADTLLLGKVIVDPGKQLIAKSEFEKVCLDFNEFRAKATRNNAIVFDARDAIQRTRDLPGLEDVKHVPLDKFIRMVVDRGIMKKNSFLIFDQVGKQVKWLMYHLVNQGYTDFYFLKGGATSVLKSQNYRLTQDDLQYEQQEGESS